MQIEEKINDLKKSMQNVESTEERYKWIIAEGRKLPPLSDSQRADKFLIEGCISQAWLVPEMKEGKISFYADSESMIVKGIMALLLRVYSGESPKTILETEPRFLQDVGVEEHLSLNRRNGLASVLKQLKLFALVMGQTNKQNALK